VDKWIKCLELELVLVNKLIKLGQEEYGNLEGNDDEIEYVFSSKLWYAQLHVLVTKRNRLEASLRQLNTRIKDLGGIIHCASDNPELAWAALNYFMLNSFVALDDLWVGEFKHEFETLREGNILPKLESPLHHTILEILKRINDSQNDRVIELEACNEQPDVTVLKTLLGV